MDKVDEINELGFIEITPDENNRFVLMTKKQKDWLISEIEQLRNTNNKLIDKMCELCRVINPHHENCSYCDEKYNFEQALSEG